MAVLSSSVVTLVYQITQYTLNIAIAIFVAYIASVYGCFDAIVWFSSSQLSKVKNYKTYNMERRVFTIIIVLNVLTLVINFLPTIMNRIWTNHWGYHDPVPTNMNFTSNQKAPSYLWGSMSASNGPIFPQSSSDMIDFFCNQTVGCGKGAGLANFTLANYALDQYNYRNHATVSLDKASLTFPLSGRSMIRMDSTTSYGGFIILRDIPCPGNHSKYSIDGVIMVSTNFTNYMSGLYCIPGDDSGFSIVYDRRNASDTVIPLMSLPASASAVLSRNRLMPQDGGVVIGSSIDLVTDEDSITYLASTSGISINIVIPNANITDALAQIGAKVNEAGFNITNQAIIKSFTSEDPYRGYVLQAIKEYSDTLSIQHAFLSRVGSDTYAYINYRTTSVARMQSTNEYTPMEALKTYAVHIYLKPQVSFNTPAGLCWKADGAFKICEGARSAAETLGPSAIYKQLINESSPLISILESRAVDSVYAMPVKSEEYYEGLKITTSWIAAIAVINSISLILMSTMILIKVPSYREDLRQVVTESTAKGGLSNDSTNEEGYKLEVSTDKENSGTVLLLNRRRLIAIDDASFIGDSQANEQGQQLLGTSVQDNLEEKMDEEKSVGSPHRND
jgi:hypothetical protein